MLGSLKTTYIEQHILCLPLGPYSVVISAYNSYSRSLRPRYLLGLSLLSIL